MGKYLLERYKRGEIDVVEDNNSHDLDTPRGYGTEFDNFSGRSTPSQLNMKYLLETDKDVPKKLKDFWSMTSYHNSLLNIQDKKQLAGYNRDNRDIIRVSLFQRSHRKVPYSDTVQLCAFANRLLTKSIGHEERILHNTTIQRTQMDDMNEKPPNNNANQSSASWLLGGIRKFVNKW
jgi:hypothetical protein